MPTVSELNITIIYFAPNISKYSKDKECKNNNYIIECSLLSLHFAILQQLIINSILKVTYI